MLWEIMSNGLLKSRHKSSIALPSSIEWIVSSQKTIRLVKNNLSLANLCCLFPSCIAVRFVLHVQGNIFHEHLFLNFPCDWSEANSPALSWIFFLALCMDGYFFHFRSHSGLPFVSMTLSKMTENDFTRLSDKYLSTLPYIMSGSAGVCMLNLFRSFLTWSFFFVCFIIASWQRDFGTDLTHEDWGKEGIRYLSLFMLFVSNLTVPFRSVPTYSLYVCLLATNIGTKLFLVIIHTTCQFELQLTFLLPNVTTECSSNISIHLFWSLSIPL